MATVLFADGHVRVMRVDQLDDSDRDGTPDNGYWNLLGDPNRQ